MPEDVSQEGRCFPGGKLLPRREVASQEGRCFCRMTLRGVAVRNAPKEPPKEEHLKHLEHLLGTSWRSEQPWTDVDIYQRTVSN